MKELQFSFIIPVFNRPHEIKELLESFTNLTYKETFEIVIVEDGSTETSEAIVACYNTQLNIAYFYKPNSGPGDSRNFGMQRAQGNFFIILDSDVILPSDYLLEVDKFLKSTYCDCFGGPDAAHQSFTSLQKAINFAMTSFITTGGIRGGKRKVTNFQPRSFNMGVSKPAYMATGGFGNIHPGEDPDLSLRLQRLGFKTQLIPKAYVYHKRRISWTKFYKQVHKFGMVRPILNQWHPASKRLVYWFPFLFSMGLMASIVLLAFGINSFFYLYLIYFCFAFILAIFYSHSLVVAVLALIAILVQFFGYGYGFIKSVFTIKVLRKKPEDAFPYLFY
ncbi:MAG: glycosyltransferase [Winogradskyella sp.]|uniref:glycosyltransferase n=1 Tax=Winogradskyella sp. TaxID=1883156 RepID=UPI0018234359|nr:glycosyltransferase [Winogradskyella sp.]